MAAEQAARQTIDKVLPQAGWSVQDAGQANIHATRGVAIRELISPTRSTLSRARNVFAFHKADTLAEWLKRISQGPFSLLVTAILRPNYPPPLSSRASARCPN